MISHTRSPEFRAWLLQFLLLWVSACSSQGVRLVHPYSGSTVKCGGSGVGLGTGWMEGFIEDRVKRYKDQGYIRLDELTPEQRAALDKRGLLPRD